MNFTSTYSTVDSKSREYNERNDCTVRATAIVSNLDYADVRNIYAKCGRRARCGCQISVQEKAFEVIRQRYNVTFEDVTDDPMIRPHLGSTVTTIGRRLPKGRYLVYVRGHVLALVDGEVHDWTAGRKHKVKMVKRVTLSDNTPAPQPETTPTPRPTPKRKKRGAGDEVSQILRDYLGTLTHKKDRKLTELADRFDLPRYENLNTGQRRMNIGNRLRSMVKRGQITPDEIQDRIRTI